MPPVTPKARPLRVVFHRTPEPDPDAPRRDMLDLLAQGLATSALRDARAEAEAALGRPLQHAPEPPVEAGPVELMKRHVLRAQPDRSVLHRSPRR